MTKFTLSGRLRSIGHALQGLGFVLKTQHNAWIHLFASVVAVGAGFYYAITPAQWIVITLAMVMVWVAETFNTALEFVCDVVHPALHPAIKKAKDIAAGAVLISALGAVVIGLLVFLPYI
ncbi:MAG: diacylglycerol kinase family protein [Methylophilaceae bacterium]|nr:diacylglycerol kinase family protein [Methylophilaceae bacterium]